MLSQHDEALAAQFRYVCDICHKGFESGQALGGHKSMHFRKGASHRVTSYSAAGMSRIGFYSDYLANNLPGSRSISLYDSKKTYTHPGMYSSNAVEELSGLIILADVCEEEQKDSNTMNGYQRVDGNEVEDFTGTSKRGKHLQLDESNKRWSTTGDDHYGYNSKVFRCNMCHRTFSSFQALGGHKSSQTKNNQFCNSVDESAAAEDELYETRIHRCNNCSRVFSSGQALGGHMSHHCSLQGRSDCANSSSNDDEFPAMKKVKSLKLIMCDTAEITSSWN